MILRRILTGSAFAVLASMTIARGLVWAADNPRGLDPSDDGLDRPVSGMPKITPMPPSPPISDEGTNNGTESGNPLWGITIETLHATRERPIFSPSRRPVMPAVLAAPPPPPPPPPVPDKPSFNLLGTVAGSGVGYAVFLDNTTHDIVRLKTGEGQDGWILRSVKNREAVLVKNDKVAVMRLPSPMGDEK
jgi:general secretion pathway protein N